LTAALILQFSHGSIVKDDVEERCEEVAKIGEAADAPHKFVLEHLARFIFEVVVVVC
jgi:hypothetical protein